ncbi:MAG TPA: hypothetical protein VGC74_11310 [Stenotrophomonas sp.]
MQMHLLPIAVALLGCGCGPRNAAEPSQVSETELPAEPRAQAPPQTAPAAKNPLDTPPPTARGTASPDATASTKADDAQGIAEVNASIDSNLGDHVRYQSVIQHLQSAVAAGDAAQVASLAQYPFVVEIAGKSVELKSEKEFVARYQDFMTPDIRDAIVQTRYADLFVNYKGVMFGRGQAWINGICRDDKCKAFDVKLVTLQHGPE